MPAGDEEHEVGEGDVLGQPRGQRMPGEVVDAVERQAAAGGDPLGEHHAGEHPADQPRTGGDRHRVDAVEAEAGALERGRGHEVEALGVGAGGDLGHDAAPLGVQPVLALDHRGEDLAPRLPGTRAHHRDGGVVAAALDPEDGAGGLHAFLQRCAGCGPQVTPARPRRNGGACPEIGRSRHGRPADAASHPAGAAVAGLRGGAGGGASRPLPPGRLAAARDRSPAGAARARRSAGGDLHLGQRGRAVRRPEPGPRSPGLVRGRHDRRGGAAGGLRRPLGGRRRGRPRGPRRRGAPSGGRRPSCTCAGRMRRAISSGGWPPRACRPGPRRSTTRWRNR